MAHITEAWTVASEFSSPSNTLDRTARDFFNSLQPAAIFAIFSCPRREKGERIFLILDSFRITSVESPPPITPVVVSRRLVQSIEFLASRSSR